MDNVRFLIFTRLSQNEFLRLKSTPLPILSGDFNTFCASPVSLFTIQHSAIS